jgi:hypothetical protein
VSIETRFEQLVGRKASEPERARLYRLRDVLGLRDNDAFWAIIMALEHYDSLFRAYPAQVAEAAGRTMENVRAVCEAAAQAHVATMRRVVAEEVPDTSAALERKVADRPITIHQVTIALATVVAFGSLCVHAGYELAASGRPFWLPATPPASSASRALLCLLSLPAGWMIFALMIPVAIHGANFGRRIARDPLALRHDRTLGWCIVVCCLLGLVACVLLLARVA